MEAEQIEIIPASLKDYLVSRQFLLIFSMNFLSIFFGTYIVSSYKSFGAQKIHDETFLSMIGAFASIFGCLRFTWSFAIDHYSFKRVYGVLMGM